MVSSGLYESIGKATMRYFTRFGIDVHYVDVKDLDAVEEALKEKETKVLYCETLTNPGLDSNIIHHLD